MLFRRSCYSQSAVTRIPDIPLPEMSHQWFEDGQSAARNAPGPVTPEGVTLGRLGRRAGERTDTRNS